MSILLRSGVFSVSDFPNCLFFNAKPGFRCSTSMKLRVESSAAQSNSPAILWYKHDLRIEDHPGLVAASKHSCVVPLYIFDPRILSRFSDEMLELLLVSLEDLRKLLKEQGTNLMIRFGNAENIIGHVAREVRATSIIVEEELEYEMCTMVDAVKQTLSSVSFAEWNPEIVMWSMPFYDIKKTLKESETETRAHLKRFRDVRDKEIR